VYTAIVELVRITDQAVISRASAECGAADEYDRNGNLLWSKRPRYARRSMAQTRATGKACRMSFSWIMKLAGYEPTPAEEMPDYEQSTQTYHSSIVPVVSVHETTIGTNSNEHRHLEAKINELGLDRERVKKWCAKQWSVNHFTELTKKQYMILVSQLPSFAASIKQAEQETREEREAIQEEANSA